ncbi:MAG TPA: MBL fold metallo-hydrolase [Candidatus Kryptonia bacterium]|nr:MBL fold metallo-hydrolase [Candidatus Kryptonia bacterium]
MTDAKIREVAAGVYVVHLPLPMRPTIVNVYLVRGGDEWALIDTGVNTSDSIHTFETALESVGCQPSQIKQIICTHHHPDHFGTSKAYKALTGARLVMHRAEYERSHTFAPHERPAEAVRFFDACGIPIERFVHIPSPAEFWSGLYVTTAPDGFIDDGDVLRVGDRELEVIWTPGHSPGHCVLLLRTEKIMIVGDHLLPKITPHVGYFPGGVSDPLGDFLASQRKVQRFDVNLVLPAHGGVFSDHRHRANQIIQHHEYRLREMLDFVHHAPHTGYEVACHAFAMDHTSPLTVQFPATFETLAHLEYLIHRGMVEKETRGDRVYYRGR